MVTFKRKLEKIFLRLDEQIEKMICARRDESLAGFPRAGVQILGQMSLLANDQVSVILSLNQTLDLDAFLLMDQVVKSEFKAILRSEGLVYDEDSYLIWIPPGANFELLFDLAHVRVELIDAESALVSKAVKAAGKNKQLIRAAIASNRFPSLVDRILDNGGNLEDFT